MASPCFGARAATTMPIINSISFRMFTFNLPIAVVHQPPSTTGGVRFRTEPGAQATGAFHIRKQYPALARGARMSPEPVGPVIRPVDLSHTLGRRDPAHRRTPTRIQHAPPQALGLGDDSLPSGTPIQRLARRDLSIARKCPRRSSKILLRLEWIRKRKKGSWPSPLIGWPAIQRDAMRG